MSKTDLPSLPETPAGASDVRAPAFPLATGYRLLSATKDHKLKNPACPYCGGKLSFSINGCELDEATGWFATDLDINCDTEPDIDGPDWEGWWADHSYDNCEKWHTLHERVVASLKRAHRVNDNNQAERQP
jgi:hypothetical protein